MFRFAPKPQVDDNQPLLPVEFAPPPACVPPQGQVSPLSQTNLPSQPKVPSNTASTYTLNKRKFLQASLSCIQATCYHLLCYFRLM